MAWLRQFTWRAAVRGAVLAQRPAAAPAAAARAWRCRLMAQSSAASSRHRSKTWRCLRRACAASRRPAIGNAQVQHLVRRGDRQHQRRHRAGGHGTQVVQACGACVAGARPDAGSGSAWSRRPTADSASRYQAVRCAVSSNGQISADRPSPNRLLRYDARASSRWWRRAPARQVPQVDALRARRAAMRSAARQGLGTASRPG